MPYFFAIFVAARKIIVDPPVGGALPEFGFKPPAGGGIRHAPPRAAMNSTRSLAYEPACRLILPPIPLTSL
jgi:hypothetical protein